MVMLKEFKEFAVKGNVVDMAVGIVIGAAFGGIVKSLVDDVVMPPFGMLLGHVDFSTFAITLKEASGNTPAVVIAYGKFLNTVINFAIVAFVLFLLIKQINRLKRETPATMKDCPRCCSKIPIPATRCPQCTADL